MAIYHKVMVDFQTAQNANDFAYVECIKCFKHLGLIDNALRTYL